MIHFYVLNTIEANRGELFPLLKPFVKGSEFTDIQRKELYGVSEEDWIQVLSPDTADLYILPMSWNYYVKNKQLEPIVRIIKQHQHFGKPIWSFTSGDFGVETPKIENVKVFRCNGNKSLLPLTHFGMPVFIPDPLNTMYDATEIVVRPYQEHPVVGFCGQANSHTMDALKDLVRIGWRNLKYTLGVRKELPQPLWSTTRLRAQLLGYCEGVKGIHTNFIRRKKYRAGAQNQEERQRTTQEFYDNIRDCDYTICMRGGGNFSVRLYETLAMGRIPVFIDTDCLLPLEDQINWKNHVVWVPFKERHLIGEKIQSFHENLGAQGFLALQQANRQLWKERLSMNGFFASLLVDC